MIVILVEFDTLSEWLPWSPCVEGTRHRKKICHGYICDTEVHICEIAISSHLEYGHWTQCSATCGFGIKSREQKKMCPSDTICDPTETNSVYGICNLKPCYGKDII